MSGDSTPYIIIEDGGSREVTREEFLAHIRELEDPNRPKPRYEHTQAEVKRTADPLAGVP